MPAKDWRKIPEIDGRYWKSMGGTTVGRVLRRERSLCDIGGCDEPVEITAWMRYKLDNATGEYVELADLYEWTCSRHGYQMRA